MLFEIWFDFWIKAMLEQKFMGPANMIARGDQMEKFVKHFSLNGIKPMCKPY